MVRDNLTAYFDWVFARMRGYIRRNADMSQVRRCKGRALSQDELAPFEGSVSEDKVACRHFSQERQAR